MKTIIKTTKRFSLIPILRFSLLTMFMMFAMIGISQNYEINKGAGGMYMVSLTGNGSNVLIDGGASVTTGVSNTLIGSAAGQMVTTGSNNTFIGKQAGFSAVGENNTVIGAAAANGQGSTVLGSGNVIIGFQAGWFESGDDKLYIENTASSSPLIYGEFDNDLVRINGTINVTELVQLKAITQPGACTGALDGAIYYDGSKLKLCSASTWQDLN